jgi:hypothetical protein
MPNTLEGIYPSVFELTYTREILEWLGTAYEFDHQTKGVSTDCSGMHVEVFKALDLEFNDRAVDDFVDENFLQATEPLRGPKIEILTLKVGADHTHMATKISPRVVIHATDDATWVAQNGGVAAVMCTSYTNWVVRAAALGTIYQWWWNFYTILSQHAAEA